MANGGKNNGVIAAVPILFEFFLAMAGVCMIIEVIMLKNNKQL